MCNFTRRICSRRARIGCARLSPLRFDGRSDDFCGVKFFGINLFFYMMLLGFIFLIQWLDLILDSIIYAFFDKIS